MKKGLIALALALLVVGIGLLIQTTLDPGAAKDTAKIVNATMQYARSFQAKGEPAPTSVALDALITAGLLKPADVSGYGNTTVVIFPAGLLVGDPRVGNQSGFRLGGSGSVILDKSFSKGGPNPDTTNFTVPRKWFGGGTNSILLIAFKPDGHATVARGDGSVHSFHP